MSSSPHRASILSAMQFRMRTWRLEKENICGNAVLKNYANWTAGLDPDQDLNTFQINTLFGLLLIMPISYKKYKLLNSLGLNRLFLTTSFNKKKSCFSKTFSTLCKNGDHFDTFLRLKSTCRQRK
jgi:hypothetical protein